MTLKGKEIQELQKIENKVYRKILGAPRYAPITTLRGNVGASLMKTRIKEGKILYLKSVVETENEQQQVRNHLLKEIIEDMKISGKFKWIKGVNKHIREVNLTHRDIKRKKKEEIKKIMNDWDTEQWKQEMAGKTSLNIYREWKKEIKCENEIYDNTPASVILYKCRANVLPLNDRKRFKGEATKCIMCENENEDLTHFLLLCPGYRKIREQVDKLQQPYIQDKDTVIGNLILNNKEIEEDKEKIYEFWKVREKRRKEKQD